MAKHRKCKPRPFSHCSRCIDSHLQLMSLLYTFAQPVGRNFAELIRGIVTCVYTRRGLQDASVYMVKLLKSEALDGRDASQSMRQCQDRDEMR